MALTQEQIKQMQEIRDRVRSQQPAQTSTLTPEKRQQMLEIQQRVRAGQQTVPTSQPKKNNFVKGVIQGAAKPFLRATTSGLNTVSGFGALIKGDGTQRAGEQAARSRNFGFFGQDIRPVGIDEQGNAKKFSGFAKDVVGTGLELGSYTLGVPGTTATAARAGVQGAKMTFGKGLENIALKGAHQAAREGFVSGAAQGVGTSLQENNSIANSLKTGISSGGFGALFGGAAGAMLPAVGLAGGQISKGTSKVTNRIVNGAALDVNETAGRVVLGQTKDQPLAARALGLSNLKGVKTYKELSERLKDTTKSLLAKQDEILGADTTKHAIDSLAESVKVGNKTASVNHVSDALNDLEELYGNTNDAKGLLEIQTLKESAANQGLTSLEVNNLSRRYGTEFGKKAFSKTGEPITSVNATRFENTRSGLKNTVGRIGGKASRDIDQDISAVLRTEKLANKIKEKVNDTFQKVNKRTLLGGLARKLGKAVDLYTGGVPKQLYNSILQESYVGKKVPDFLSIEEQLARRLKLFEKASKMPESIIQKILKKAPKGLEGLKRGSIKSGGKEMYGFAAGFAPEKDENGNVRIVFKPENALIGMIGASVATRGAKTLTKVHADDLGTMSDFTDYVAGEYVPDLKTALQLEKDARRIAEHYGFKLVKSSDGLAFEFGKQLEKRGFLADRK